MRTLAAARRAAVLGRTPYACKFVGETFECLHNYLKHKCFCLKCARLFRCVLVTKTEPSFLLPYG